MLSKNWSLRTCRGGSQWRFEHLLIPFLVALAQLRWHRVIPRTAHAYAECYSPRPHRHLPG
ncbi:hypothetical protein C0091_13570 [Mycobacterium tuberculosis]|nr:hypothetical protein BTU11_13590 [Mycobacterium tuberculosis]ASZ22781.1 hypothetical protein CK482_13540 [Mycobacterium tuberculosis]AUP56236.1 hypothetical protein C0085_13565 [Mycobacterium tuberculosis]AUP60375.1 hypothetical protein C0093_13560 [Mycobacterium tuberculosis]AUP64505.1 hypothetical protein C0082_13565 [Mycobacterium tuberculosis]